MGRIHVQEGKRGDDIYSPAIVNAKTLERFELGPYTAILYGDIEASGMVRYKYILAILNDGEPRLFVSSEVNIMADELGGGSHFLCVFKGDSHLNFGSSDDWADLETFKPKAIEMAREHLGL